MIGIQGLEEGQGMNVELGPPNNNFKNPANFQHTVEKEMETLFIPLAGGPTFQISGP